MIIGSMNKRHATESKVDVDWEIENFLSRLNSSDVDGADIDVTDIDSTDSNSARIYKSPPFTWSSISWELHLKYYSGNEIQLYLNKFKSVKQIVVVLKFGIQLVDGTTEMRCSLIKNFEESASGFGTRQFILISELVNRKHELLPAGILIISCSIDHLDTLTKCQNAKYENLDALSSNFETIYGCTSTSDMTIIVESQSYPVHKTILAARSDVFAAMFKHDMEEVNSGIVKIADCESTSFKDFLLYLYTGKVENFSWSNVYHLYKTADMYNVRHLKDLCIRYMKRNMATSNLFDIAILANQFSEIGLTYTTQEFFNRNALEIIRRDDWEQFLRQNFLIANEFLINMLEKVNIED